MFIGESPIFIGGQVRNKRVSKRKVMDPNDKVGVFVEKLGDTYGDLH